MGFIREELEAARGRGVADLIGPGLKLLFVGINPGLWTAASGAHFAHPANRFYRALYVGGILDEELDVTAGFDDRGRSLLIGRGIGITNLVNRATARADELKAEDLRRGLPVVRKKVTAWCPEVVAFVGLTACRTAFHRPDCGIGRQEERFAGAELWVLPNPSGLNAHFQVEGLARLYRKAAAAAGIEVSPVRFKPRGRPSFR